MTGVRRAAALFFILAVPSLLVADVTLVYRVETKPNPALPPALAQAMTTLQNFVNAPERKVLLKGGKSYTTYSLYNIISDLPNDAITLLDPVNKHFATIPASQYASAVAGAVSRPGAAAQSMLAALKITAESSTTGRTDTIQGIQAAEREITLSVSAPAIPGMPPGPMMKLVVQIWLATPQEIAGNPILREFVASGYQTPGGLSPAESIQKALSQFPGLGDSMSAYLKEIADSHSAMLRVHAQAFMPMFSMLARRGADNPAAGFDPAAPVVEMNEELVSLSGEPVADATFAIPDGYTAAPLADIISAGLPKPASAPSGSTPR